MQMPSAFRICGGGHFGGVTHLPSTISLPRGQMHVPATGPGTIGGGHMQTPSAFKICRDGHFGSGTHSPPSCTVPSGHLHGPGTSGGGQICGTHLRSCITVPGVAVRRAG